MRSRLPAVLFAFALIAWSSGCAQPPTDAVAAARQSLEAVSAQDATTYAPAAYKAAQDAAAQLEAELAAQEGAWFPNYDRVNQLTAELQGAVAKIQPAMTAEQERLRADANRMVQEARSADRGPGTIDELPARAASKDSGPSGRTRRRLPKRRGRVEKLIAAGQLAEARQQAEAAAKSAATVTSAIGQVQTAVEQARAEAAERAAQGDATLPRAVMADGQPLAAGTYVLRLGDEVQTPAGGTQRWVEFVRNGAVAGRALAVVNSDAEVRDIQESPGPRNEARVETLKGGDYVRVWLHRGGVNYLLHLPPR